MKYKKMIKYYNFLNDKMCSQMTSACEEYLKYKGSKYVRQCDLCFIWDYSKIDFTCDSCKNVYCNNCADKMLNDFCTGQYPSDNYDCPYKYTYCINCESTNENQRCSFHCKSYIPSSKYKNI